MSETKHTPEVLYAVSHSCDFSEGTWTFQPKKAFKVKAGLYAIMNEAEYTQLKSQRDELLAALKDGRQMLISLANEVDSNDLRNTLISYFGTAIANAEKGGSNG